jgi:battenin
MQLGMVYFFEYAVSVGFAARANPDPSNPSFWSVSCYEILATCYQIGVLISRSSLSLIKIHRIERLTILQAVNFALWASNSYLHFLPLWTLFPLMIYVGLIGGAMYVNVFYLLLEESCSPVPLEDRELAINFSCALSNFGVILSSVLELILDHR